MLPKFSIQEVLKTSLIDVFYVGNILIYMIKKQKITRIRTLYENPEF